jgi:hypothetical protein
MAGGSLDRVGRERIEGWAWDRQKPDTPIAVEIYDEETLVVTVTADRPRQDLVKGHKGNGRHGFVVQTPPSLSDGKMHVIHAKVAGGFELNKSPQELECPDARSLTPLPANWTPRPARVSTWSVGGIGRTLGPILVPRPECRGHRLGSEGHHRPKTEKDGRRMVIWSASSPKRRWRSAAAVMAWLRSSSVE